MVDTMVVADEALDFLSYTGTTCLSNRDSVTRGRQVEIIFMGQPRASNGWPLYALVVCRRLDDQEQSNFQSHQATYSAT